MSAERQGRAVRLTLARMSLTFIAEARRGRGFSSVSGPGQGRRGRHE
jgi:hypothetical protein